VGDGGVRRGSDDDVVDALVDGLFDARPHRASGCGWPLQQHSIVNEEGKKIEC
jgi:hypothetical protein